MKNICYESTSKCMLACPYCISSDNGTLIQDNYQEIINFIGSLHPERIVIGGGEPLLDPLLKEKIQLIINKYKENNENPYISLSTSGACEISEEMWQFLKERIQCFDISIPSLNSDTYKLMRGKDFLNQALINTKKAVEHGLNVRISIVMTKQNKSELPDILMFAERIKVNSVRVGRYFPFRNANAVRDTYELEETEVLQIIQDINNGKYNNIYTRKIIPPIKTLDMMNGYLNVDFNGELFIPTEYGKQIIGNVNEINITELDNSLNEAQQKIFIKAKEIIK